ncbi:MAG TPA: helix-turn-helix domain-containing protein [Polyangiaceae bacterium]|nr:helix-turn-helix domain-containing protein [Polyangiaceae bacterium]
MQSARPGAPAPGPRRALFACCSPEPRLARLLEPLAVDVVSVPRPSDVDARLADWQPVFLVLDLDAAGAGELALGLGEGPLRAARVVLLASAGTVFLAMKCLGSRRADHVLMKPADAGELAAILSAEGAATELPRLPSLERIQWEYIHAVLGSCDGNVSEAARQLGIYRQSLQRMLRRHPPGR